MDVEVNGQAGPDGPGARPARLVGGGGAGARGNRLRVPPRRRRPSSRPALAAPAVRARRGEQDLRPRRLRLERRRVARRAGERRGDLRAARRHVHPGGDAGRRDRAARPPDGARRHGGGADAGRRVPRRARLGLRRDRAVGRARALRRAGRAQAVRGRLPRPRARRLPRRRLQPRRPGQPARLVRPVLHRRLHDPVGAGGQPGPAGLRRGALLHRRQRADVAA